MRVKQTDRNFRFIEHVTRPAHVAASAKLLQESSMIGDYENSWDEPGSSFLWIGPDHHLNREEVREMIEHMQYWLDNGRLKMKDE